MLTLMKAALGLVTLSAVNAAPADDKLGDIPHPDPSKDPIKYPTDSYSGYLKATETKELHYVFLNSMGDPTKDPVLIWFNGGPGCSSMLGLLQELGPIIVEMDGSVSTNPHPWNQNANVLYIEQPAGVGYSIAGATQDFETNDFISSNDTLNALLDFYTKFSEFANNDLFISGESYAGIYVPYLSWRVYQHNEKMKMYNMTQIPLKGHLVGNGATKWKYDVFPSFADTLYGFNMIPTSLYEEYNAKGCIFFFNSSHVGPDECNTLFEKMQNLTADLNWYDLYQDASMNPLHAVTPEENRTGTVLIDGVEKTFLKGMKKSEYTPWLKGMIKEDPILGANFSTWMNQADVKTAWHTSKQTETWNFCNQDTLHYHLTEEASYWIYPILRLNNHRMVFYSGDTDGAVPTWGTKRWIRELNWDVKKEWRPWMTGDQVSGFVINYDGLDFVTVKGVGHMAPQYAREAVTNFVTSWMADTFAK